MFCQARVGPPTVKLRWPGGPGGTGRHMLSRWVLGELEGSLGISRALPNLAGIFLVGDRSIAT